MLLVTTIFPLKFGYYDAMLLVSIRPKLLHYADMFGIIQHRAWCEWDFVQFMPMQDRQDYHLMQYWMRFGWPQDQYGLILWTMHSTFHFLIYLCLGVSSYDRVTISFCILLCIEVRYSSHTYIRCSLRNLLIRWQMAGGWQLTEKLCLEPMELQNCIGLTHKHWKVFVNIT